MDEELIVDPKFQKGFNHGYILAEHEPELATQIVANKNEHSEYFSGIASGKQEHDMEKIRERLKGVSRNETPTKTISKDKGRSR
jgi:hypothetical protein